MAIRIFRPGGAVDVIAEDAVNPDDTPDEDVLVLRRVLFQVAQRTGLTQAEVRALFRQAKRAVD